MNYRLLSCIAMLTLLGGEATEVAAQRSLNWTGATYPITLDEGKLGGSGAEWLVRHAENCQFVIFGEQHGVKGLPAVVSASFNPLFEQGYRYLALEIDPWLATRFNTDGIDDGLQTAPHSLAFDYDGDVRMMKTFHSVVGTKRSIWGLDQPVTAIHSYERLSKVLPTFDARRKARGLFLKAAIQAGGYIKNNNSSDVTVLRQAIGDDMPDEADLILSSVETSMRIYVSYLAGQRGEGPRGVSDAWREQYMKDLLQRQLSQAQSESNQIPKVIFKMGGAHLMEGIGPNGVETLGEFAQQVAASNNLDALNIGIRAWRDDSGVPDAVFEDGNTIVLIETRNLRDDEVLFQEAALSETLRRDISQFDSLIYLRDAQQDSKSLIRTHEIAFRNRLIAQVALIALALVVMLTAVVPWVRVAISRLRRRAVASSLLPLMPWAVLSTIGWSIAGVVGLQISRLLAVGAPMAAALSNSLIPTIAVVCAGGVVCGLGLSALSRSWWTAAVRTHFLIVCVSTCTSLGFCAWWNLGGMLG